MIYINYTKNNDNDVKLASDLFLELNRIMPDQIFMDLSKDSNFWQILPNSNNNIFIFLNSKYFFDDSSCWQMLDQAWKLKQDRKIHKIIEIKLDEVKSPNFLQKNILWIDYVDNLENIINSINKGISDDNWNNFSQMTNFIYIKTYYKNIVENNEAILVNENEEWDVIIIKVKSIHQNIKKWNYSIVANKIWIDDFYTTKPKITFPDREIVSSEPWMASSDLFFKTNEAGAKNEINYNNWQSFIFFKDFFMSYEITNISLTITDLIQNINYTIQVL